MSVAYDQTSALADLHARRFDGIERPYSQADVERLRGSIRIEYTLAARGARRLWELLHTRPVAWFRGANEVVERNVEPSPDVDEFLRHAIAVRLRLQTELACLAHSRRGLLFDRRHRPSHVWIACELLQQLFREARELRLMAHHASYLTRQLPRQGARSSPRRLRNPPRCSAGILIRADHGAGIPRAGAGEAVGRVPARAQARDLLGARHHVQPAELLFTGKQLVHDVLGVRVEQGQSIGRVGESGTATGPHLDYRIIKNGTYVNPLVELKRMPKGDPISPDAQDAFFRERDAVLARLSQGATR